MTVHTSWGQEQLQPSQFALSIVNNPNHAILFPPTFDAILSLCCIVIHMHFMLAVVSGYIIKQKQKNQEARWYSDSFKQYKCSAIPACIFIFTV